MVWVTNRGRCGDDPAGRHQVLGTITDVSDRKEAELAVHKSEVEYRALFESAGTGNIEVDLATKRFLRVNRKFCEIVGYSAEELLTGVTFLDITHPDDRERNAAPVGPPSEGRDGVFEIEQRYVRKDATIVWAHLTSSLIRGAQGRSTRMLGSVTDITARKLSEVHLRLTIDAVPALISYIDEQFCFRWANEHYRRWFGRGPEGIAGRHVREVLGEPAWGIVQPYMARALAGEVVTYEELLPYADVAPRWVRVTYTPDFGEAGRVLGLVAHVTDISERKQGEAALAQERARLALALHTGELGAYEWQVGENTVWWSPELYPLFGVDPATFTPTVETFSALVHPDDRAELWRRTEESLAHRTVFELEYRVVRPDGALRWFHNRSHVEAGIAGAQRVTGALADITTRRTQAAAIEARREQLALLASVSQRLILGSGSEAEVLQAVFGDVARTIGAEMYFSYRPHDEVSMRLCNWGGLTDDERTLFATMRYGELLCGRVAVRRQPIVVEDIANTTAEGSEAVRAAGYGAYAGFPLLADDRLLGTIAFILRERTHFRPGEVQTIQTACDQVAATLERVRLTAELRAGEERLRLALSAARAGAWAWDLRTGAISWSPENYALYGLDPASGPPGYADWERTIHPDDLGRVNEAVRDTLAGRTPEFRAEFRVRHPIDGTRWLLGRGRAARDPTGEPLRMTGINLDISERKQLEATLVEQDKRKDVFLATLAHELRNPLAPVRNAVQILRMKAPDVPELQWARDVIGRQVHVMTRLIDDLMDVSRINQGKVVLKRGQVDLATIVHDAVETSRPLIDEAGHRLDVTLPPRPVIVDGDPTRLGQVLLNLLNNAAKYTARGGRIDLRAELQGSDVVVSVVDTGFGIPADRLSTIFEMFSQVEDHLSRSRGGLGIGLYLVKQLVEMHGGTIEARSGGRGQGSEFVVRLPIVVAQTFPREARDDGDKAEPTSHLRILVVDDHPDAAESLAMLLEIMGNHVHTAHDGEEALKAAEEFRPHLVLCDIGLPKLNGYEVCRQLKQQAGGQKMTLIALTGWGQEDDRRRSKEAGFDHHMVKPVDPTALAKMLAGVTAATQWQTAGP